MPYALPTCPPPATYSIDIDTLRRENSPSFGGPDRRYTRLGSRHIATVTLENMTASQARVWRNRLSNEDDTVVWNIPTKGLQIGNPGAPVVNGGGQTGSSILLGGLTPGYVIFEDQYIPIVTGGRVYLYKARGQVTANGSGNVTVPLNCILRVSHIGGDLVEIANPVIEGFVTDMRGFDIHRRRAAGAGAVISGSFTIKERR